MAINIILGFVLPWAAGFYLYFKSKTILLILAPYASAWAFTINDILFNLNFDRFVPINVSNDLTTLSVNLGLYPVLGSYMIYFIHLKKMSPYVLIFAFTCFTTLAEALGVLYGLVAYYNGWTIGWTIVSYILPYFACYWYYRVLNKYNVFS